jgi:hypothetical protein
MSSTAEFALFVREQLLSMVGFAEKHTVDFVVALAKRAASASALGAALRDEAGIDNGALAAAIFARVPSSGVSRDVAALQQRKVAADAARRELELNAAYRTLMDDIKPSTVSSTTPSTTSAATTSSKSQRRKRIDDDDNASDSDSDNNNKNKKDKEKSSKHSKKSKSRSKDAKDDDDEDYQYAREQREIAEFEERLRERDKKRTKKVTEAQGSKAARPMPPAAPSSPPTPTLRANTCRGCASRRAAPISRSASRSSCVCFGSASKTRSFSSRASR